jgi:hypothetical protein
MVLDYVLRDKEMRNEVEKIEIGGEIVSNYQPVVLWITSR